MSTIITRQTGATAKNSALTNTELDNNFINLNTDKMESSNNLSDVSSASTARTNLSVYSQDEVQNQAIQFAIALG